MSHRTNRPRLLPRVMSLSACIVVVTAACGTAPSANAPPNDEASSTADDPVQPPTTVQRAAALLAGRFESSAQAASDPRYFPVQLHACRIAMPLMGEDVLYVEQAMLSSVDQPYRQRVYVLSAPDAGTVLSEVNEIDRPERVIGLCDRSDDERAASAPQPSEIVPLTGCLVTLRADDAGFVGGTEGKACLNDHNGAVYATSEVTLRDSGIESWDRGYDANDAQVWGATAGAYRFDRMP